MKETYQKFANRIRTLRVAQRWVSGGANDATVVPVEDDKDKEERLVRGMMFFHIPGGGDEVPLADAIGASMVLGNQDGKYLYIFISLQDNQPSYIGNVVDFRQIPGTYILKHPNMAEARFQEYKNQEALEDEEKAQKDKARQVMDAFQVWADGATIKAWERNPVGEPFDPEGRDLDTRMNEDNHGQDTLERFIEKDADFIINVDHLPPGLVGKKSFYSTDVRDKVKFLKELCDDFFLSDPRRWFEDKPFIELKNEILDTLVYEYPGIGTDPLNFRQENLLDVISRRKQVDEFLDSDLNESERLDIYLDAAVDLTAKTFDTAKALHTLDVVDVFNGLAGYMMGAMAPDNSFHMGTLVGHDLGPIADDADEEKQIQEGFKRVYNKLAAAHLWQATQRDPFDEYDLGRDKLVSLWYLLKRWEMGQVPSSVLVRVDKLLRLEGLVDEA